MSATPVPTRLNDCLRHQRLTDAAAQASAQDWLDIECCQIDSGQYQGSLTRLETPGADLFVEQHDCTIHKFGRIPENRCTVSVLNDIHTSGWFMQRDLTGDDSLFLLPGGTEFDVCLAGATSTLYIAFYYDELLAGLRQLDPARWEAPDSGLMCLQTSRRAAFVEAAMTLMDRVHRRHTASLNRQILQRRLLHAAQMALNGTGSSPSSEPTDRQSRRRQVQTVRRARRYMHECIDGQANPSMVEVCAHAGVPERTVQYSFRRLLGITPVAYWRRLRLHRAREVLRRPHHEQETVTSIATRFGFLHLGRFARDYRRQFGEPPSVTLKRAHAGRDRYRGRPVARQDISG